jgi:hypothetical protein
LHLCDEIIVIDKGEMVEYGTFAQLMAKKGLMAKLVSENVQIIHEPEEFKPELRRQSSTPVFGLGHTHGHGHGHGHSSTSLGFGSRSFSHHQLHSIHPKLPSIEEGASDKKDIALNNNHILSNEQHHNRTHISQLNSIVDTDENMAVLIEANQMLGQDYPRESLIREIHRSRLSIVSAATSIEEITPSDAEPMKLVLDDQSVNYKLNPGIAYLRAGWGIIITLTIFVYFFLVHLLRILSGKLTFNKLQLSFNSLI